MEYEISDNSLKTMLYIPMSTQQNSGGKIYYGMHFYPGVAQYTEPNKEPYRIYLNEDTLRKMDSTFAGKPIFVEHVSEVTPDIKQLRTQSEGWVIESFFNPPDGKHWCKFITVSNEADRAIAAGFKLSNAYIPKLNSMGGTWNGVSYQAEVVNGEYEHLAIVKNPRYEESVILTPEQFKMYNENLQVELKRISNSKKEKPMLSKLKFWNRKEVDNTHDLQNTFVTLPKSQTEISIEQLVNAMDEEMEKKKDNMADPKAMVKMHDGKMCNVGELVDKHKQLHEEFSTFKDSKKIKKNREEDDETGLAMKKEKIDVEGDLHNEAEEDKPKQESPEDDEVVEKKEKEEKSKELKKENKGKMKNEATPHFDSIKNAHLNAQAPATFESSMDKVARGKTRYGS